MSSGGRGGRRSAEEGLSKSRSANADPVRATAVRVRPPLRASDAGYELIPQRFQRSMAQVTSPTSLAIDGAAPGQGRKLFVFDQVFAEDVRQAGVYEYVADSVAAFLQGYNVSVLAYGQSGAGKSYTMGTSGPQEQNDEELMGTFCAIGDWVCVQRGRRRALTVWTGIIPRAARALFDKLTPGPPELRRTGSAIKKPNRYSTSALPAVNGARSARSGDRGWQLKATYVEVRPSGVIYPGPGSFRAANLRGSLQER